MPLWFGAQSAPDQANPVYGTARTVSALTYLPPEMLIKCKPAIEIAVDFLIDAQSKDATFHSHPTADSSIEETALALDALASYLSCDSIDKDSARHKKVSASIASATAWLIENTQIGKELKSAPIGLYFAKLWYDEKLYPHIFTLAALIKVKKLIIK